MAIHRLPVRLILGLGLAIALDTATQLLWKSAVLAFPEMTAGWQQAVAALQQPLLLGVVLLMIGQFLNWRMVLGHADLSFAHAITSLSYVTVASCSVLLLDERVDWIQAAGIVLILAGVWQVSGSGHATVTHIPSETDAVK